jgi:pectate lyase
VKNTCRYALLASAILATLTSAATGGQAHLSSKPFVEAVCQFADTVVERGRDAYGQRHTPLFVDGLHIETLEPARWQCRGQTWVLSNFASQQPLLRTLDALTALTGQTKYRNAAQQATRHALKHLATPNGLLYWGGHLAWDLQQERAVGQYANVHELKGHQPYYRLMWQVDAHAAKKLMEVVWATHILDWASLDYNRHANTDKPAAPQWNANFDEDMEVPFPTQGGNLSFVNVMPPLMHSGVMLAVLDKNPSALTWTRRLVHRWQQGRHPQTGLCGGQLSYRRSDRAHDALGHVHSNINEAKIVACYHQVSRYHHLPLAQMLAGQTLIAAGGDCAEVGRTFIRWASDDLKAYAQHSYDPKTGLFVALMTDGTPIDWRQSRTGYYVPSSFAPRKPDDSILWSYATAYRLTRDATHWQVVRQLARRLDLGELGRPDGSGRALRLDTDHRHWRAIYALLELHRATDDKAMLQLAGRIANNILKTQTKTGLFPRPGRLYARTGDEIPLAILHFAAAVDGKRSSLPPAIFDSRFFHCEYHGSLSEHQKKRADKRTYDHLVYYGEH